MALARDLLLEEIRACRRTAEPLAFSHAAGHLKKAARALFGGWPQAIEAAGFDYREVRLRSRLSDEELLDWLRTMARERPGMTLSEVDLERHSGTCRKRWGDLEEAARVAGLVDWPVRVGSRRPAKVDTASRRRRRRAARGRRAQNGGRAPAPAPARGQGVPIAVAPLPHGARDAPWLEERWAGFAREVELAAMSWSPAPMTLLTLPLEAAAAGRIDLVRALASPLATLVHRRAELLDLTVVGATHVAVAAVVEVLTAANAPVSAALAKRAAAWAPPGRTRTMPRLVREPAWDALPRWPGKNRDG